MSRALILSTLRRNLPPPAALPELPSIAGVEQEDHVATFRLSLEAAGGRFLEMPDESSARDYAVTQSATGQICEPQRMERAGNTDVSEFDAPWDVSLCRGPFGVVENGAVWVDGDAHSVRRSLFLCRHLILMVPGHALVPTMHEAYARIQRPEIFGCFIAGPSKTADIEQCLVIGAHAAKAVTVVLIRRVATPEMAK